MKRSFGLIEKVSRAGNWSHKVDHMKEWYDIQCNVLMKREELRRSERYADLIETHDIKQIIINIMGDFNLVRTEDTHDILKAEKLHHFFALVFSRFINNEEYNRLPAFVNLLLDFNCIYPNMRKEWIENKKTMNIQLMTEHCDIKMMTMMKTGKNLKSVLAVVVCAQ